VAQIQDDSDEREGVVLAGERVVESLMDRSLAGQLGRNCHVLKDCLHGGGASAGGSFLPAFGVEPGAATAAYVGLFAIM
jgi:hypothetical protein